MCPWSEDGRAEPNYPSMSDIREADPHQMGLWFSGIIPPWRGGGPGFDSPRVHFFAFLFYFIFVLSAGDLRRGWHGGILGEISAPDALCI